MKIKGFTLSEVLITLGIIGVVAALTIPNLIAHYRAMVLESQFKKAYSILSNASQILVSQDKQLYNMTMEERRETLHDILGATNCPNNKSTCGGSWKNLTGTTAPHLTPISLGPSMLLKDGMMLRIGKYNWLFIDINGHKKGPNRSGWDFHVFKIAENNNIVPIEYPKDKKDTRVCTFGNPESTDSYLGYGCTGFAASNINPDGDGNYWYDFLNQK